MEMTGEYRIAASRAEVWAALNDPEVLKASIPGCESLDMTSPTEMVAKVVAKIGPVKATFTGKVHLDNIVPPESYTISGEGSGGVAGSAKGGADVKLVEDGSQTILTYTARAQITGKLAQLGSRLIDATAKMMADQFFSKFSAVVTAHAAAAEAPAPAAAAETQSAPEPTAAAAEPARASTPRVSPATAAPIPAGPVLPAWVWPAVALVVGILIGKFVI
jgi:uncharacterized protein